MPVDWEAAAATAAALLNGDDFEIEGAGGGEASGAATVDACHLYSAILSLYASFNDSMELWPSLDVELASRLDYAVDNVVHQKEE